MRTKYFILLSVLATASIALTGMVYAQTDSGLEKINYPIAELGNCKDKDACRAYCDIPANIKACIEFAEKNNLMSKDEVEKAKNFISSGFKGPGGCQGKDQCEAFCNKIENIDACIEFGDKNKLMSSEKLGEAKKMQAAIKRGVKPPQCKDKNACDKYCDEADHMEECMTFGIEAGFIEGRELEDAQKMLAALKRGIKRPACRGKEACDAYCSDQEHMEECMSFAREAGIMDEKESAEAQKMLNAIKKGAKQPQCRGKEECDKYCSSPEHMDECMAFAEAAGMMSREDVVRARSMKGRTPGNCTGKEDCEAFCKNPDNQETCMNFIKENELMSQGDLNKMETDKQQFGRAMDKMPPEVAACVSERLGSDVAEKIKSGELMPSKELGEKMSECFRNMQPERDGDFREGPGGCKTPEECKAYCEKNPDECKQEMRSPVGMMPPRSSTSTYPKFDEVREGPGGCKTPEECKTYCLEHPDECRNLPPQRPTPTFDRPPEERTNDYNRPPTSTFPQGINCTTREECEKLREKMMQRQPVNMTPPPERDRPFENRTEEYKPFTPPQGVNCSTPEECEKLREQMMQQRPPVEMMPPQEIEVERENTEYRPPSPPPTEPTPVQ